MTPVLHKKFGGIKFECLAGPMTDSYEDKQCLGSMIHTLMQRGMKAGEDYHVERRKIGKRVEYWLWLASKHYKSVDDTRKQIKRKKVKSIASPVVRKEAAA